MLALDKFKYMQEAVLDICIRYDSTEKNGKDKYSGTITIFRSYVL